MLSYQITTARSSFDETKADKRYPCAGCGGPIPEGATMFAKPYFRKGKVVGATRLHNLSACWEDNDEAAINSLIHRRETRTRARA